jgi:hypothetical protein
MLTQKRVLRSYGILLKLLKFSIKNASNPAYREFSLISSFLQLLKDLNDSLKDVFNPPFNYMEEEYDYLLRAIFKDELQEYLSYIDNNEKKELIQRFKLLIDLANCAIEREGEVQVDIIDRKLKIVMNSLSPLLKKVKLL